LLKENGEVIKTTRVRQISVCRDYSENIKQKIEEKLLNAEQQI
jgi:hypothetical protein